MPRSRKKDTRESHGLVGNGKPCAVQLLHLALALLSRLCIPSITPPTHSFTLHNTEAREAKHKRALTHFHEVSQCEARKTERIRNSVLNAVTQALHRLEVALGYTRVQCYSASRSLRPPLFFYSHVHPTHTLRAVITLL